MASNALKELVGEDIYRDFFMELERDFGAAATQLASFPGVGQEPVSDPYLTPPPCDSPDTPVTAPPSLTLDDAELEDFVDAQRNENTKRKTKSDLGKWYRWCESVGETRNIGEIPRADLDRLLGHFYCKVRRENGELYEPGILTCFQRSLDRHLNKELHKSFSIIRDIEFTPSNEKLKAARKMLKKEGKGNKPNAAEALEEQEISILWETGALGEKSPESLQNTVWYLLTVHMGMRGRDEHYKLLYGDFEVQSTADGTLKYVDFSERDTKTRTGEFSDTHAFKPKKWSTPHNTEHCPVRIFEKYLSKRPPQMNTRDSPFYLAINCHPARLNDPWYKWQRMGKNELGQIMKTLAKSGELKGKKTNPSARKTMIATLAKHKSQKHKKYSYQGIIISTAPTHTRRYLFSSRRKCHTF